VKFGDEAGGSVGWPGVPAPGLVFFSAHDGAHARPLRVIRGAAHLANVSSAAEVTATLLAHLDA